MSTDNGSIDAAIARLSSSEFIEPLCCDDFDPKYTPSLCGAFEQWLSERREHVAEALDGKGFPDDGSRDVEVFGAIPDAYDFLFSPDFERERGYARMAALTRALDNLGLNGYWGPPPEDAAGLRSVLADLETELAFAPTPEAVDYLTHKREVWRGLLVEAEKREFLTPQQMASEMGMLTPAAVERFITKGEIATVTVDGEPRITPAEVERFRAQHLRELARELANDF